MDESFTSIQAEDRRIREQAEQAGVDVRNMRIILQALRLGAFLSEQGHPESRVTAIVGAFATARLADSCERDRADAIASAVNAELTKPLRRRGF